MLSLFPSMFDWDWYVPFAFRIVLAYHFFNIGLATMKRGSGSWRVIGAASGLNAALLVAGALVQIAAVSGALLSLAFVRNKRANSPYLRDSRAFYLLLGLVSLSLLFLGPGPYAFDLPL